MIGRGGVQKFRGVGEAPGYYCYDANRPSWLPYWIDTPTESACKYNPKTIAGNLVYCLTGDPSCGKPSAAAADPTLSGPGIAAPGEATNVPTCSSLFQSYDPASNQCQVSNWVYVAMGGLGLLLVMAKL